MENSSDCVSELTPAQLFASYVYVLCQAVDLRAMQAEFEASIVPTLVDLLARHFPDMPCDYDALLAKLASEIRGSFENTSTLDLRDRVNAAARAAALTLYSAVPVHAASVPQVLEELSESLFESYSCVRLEYLQGAKTASPSLGRTCTLYDFVRQDLAIHMHGLANLDDFKGDGASAFGRRSVGDCVSAIYESMRDGRMQKALMTMFRQDGQLNSVKHSYL